MAESIVKKEQGTWQGDIIAQESYGTIVAYYNATLKIATLVWKGNGTAPTVGVHNFTLSAIYKPRTNCIVPVRNGDTMEIGTDCILRITTTTSTWSASTLTYPLA